MEKSRKMTYAMIEVAIEKAIRDIGENPRRGIRNLVDLGTRLTSGRFLQDFFRISRQILADNDSPYYELTQHVINNVDHKILKDFGIRLGYNSLTYGANQIRIHRNERSYYVPWMLVFDLRQANTNMLTPGEISAILQQGESLGIYCGMFFVNNNPAYLHELRKMLTSHQESAFLVFAEPEIITVEIAEEMVNASNVALVLHLQTGAENQAAREAFKILLAKQCLYGAYCEYNDQNITQVMSETYLQQIKAAHCTFVFLIGEALEDASHRECFSQFMQTTKNANQYPFFIYDFYADSAHIARTIWVENCFLAICGDGGIAINNMNTLQDGLNIRTNSLISILEATMPQVNHL